MISSLRNSVSLLALLTLLSTASTVTAEFKDGNKQLGISPGGKAAFIDYNNDGWIDLFAGQLWKNEGGKKFVPAKDSKAPGGEVIWGDFDNDGNVDVFQFTGAGSLHRNKGDGTFEAVEFPKLPTVNSRGASWLDINNDGLLDLYVGGYEIWTKTVHPDAIYINQGGGKFAKHWQSKDGNYSARGVTAGDFNEDGFVDVYVSNYRLQPNHLWQNGGKGKGLFSNVAMDVGAAGKPSQVIPYTGGIRYPVCGHTIGSCFGDMDNDGHLDIFVGNFAHGAAYQNRSQFLKNLGPKGKYKFEDKTAGSGLGYQESYASPALGDFDNDGDLDLATSGLIMRNRGNGQHWLKVRLQGSGVNAFAIGARVQIQIGKWKLIRQVEGGTGEGNQNDLTLHFGLGKHKDPVEIEVQWPDGTQQLETSAVDRCIEIFKP